MEIYLNELSIHRQFHDTPSSRDAFVRLMELRKVARRFGHDMHSPRTILTAEPLLGVTVLESAGIEVDPRNQHLKKLPSVRLKAVRPAGPAGLPASRAGMR